MRLHADVPADTNREGAVFPRPTLDNRHLATEKAARAVQDLVTVAVLRNGGVVAMAGMHGDATVVGVEVRHAEWCARVACVCVECQGGQKRVEWRISDKMNKQRLKLWEPNIGDLVMEEASANKQKATFLSWPQSGYLISHVWG